MNLQNVAGKYEYLDHMTDLKIRAFAPTLEGAFTHCAQAVIASQQQIHTGTKRAIIPSHDSSAEQYEASMQIISEKLTSLLYDFLTQIVMLLDTKGYIEHIHIAKIVRNKKWTLTFTYKTKGVCVNSLKAVTYYDMSIEEQKNEITKQNQFVIIVVLDV